MVGYGSYSDLNVLVKETAFACCYYYYYYYYRHHHHLFFAMAMLHNKDLYHRDTKLSSSFSQNPATHAGNSVLF